MHTEFIEFDHPSQQYVLFGTHDAHVKSIEKALNVMIILRDSKIEIKGEEAPVKIAAGVIETLKKMADENESITDIMISQAIDIVSHGEANDTIEAMKDVIAITSRGKPVRCKTIGQKKYIKAIEENTVTVCIGPAGTGKTYLAIAMAVKALRNKEVSRIILTRPAVEAGEKLGFLPGDLQSKVDPYLRPLYDALYEFLGEETVKKHLETGVIEVAPIAYLRGRTLNSVISIVDESQNATIEMHKMILTRLGEGSKMILTGDITQIDLPNPQDSGLKPCANILKGIDDIGVVYLNDRDVVRHKLVKEIVRAFEKHETKDKKNDRYHSRRDTVNR